MTNLQNAYRKAEHLFTAHFGVRIVRRKKLFSESLPKNFLISNVPRQMLPLKRRSV